MLFYVYVLLLPLYRQRSIDIAVDTSRILSCRCECRCICIYNYHHHHHHHQQHYIIYVTLLVVIFWSSNYHNYCHYYTYYTGRVLCCASFISGSWLTLNLLYATNIYGHLSDERLTINRQKRIQYIKLWFFFGCSKSLVRAFAASTDQSRSPQYDKHTFIGQGFVFSFCVLFS